ncbi:unnamed protein product [Paramecium pentaurelia]|uniref:PARG catalytic Macro domain-containing protein n=1 Tax=Paramecium pentaurelia TaxID=43138 RepID=A0A8S1U6X6_9CILI|nr:unnamed protein product [Paramecium pentaurelia]
MLKQDQEFQCFLVDNEYSNLVDQQETFKKIDKQTDSQFCNFLKNKILNDKNKLEQLLIRINDQWNKNQIVELKREEIFTLIILMFLKLIYRQKQFGGFYIINMDNLKRAQNQLCYQKMLCIENYIMLYYQNQDNVSNFSFDSDEKVIFKDQIIKFIKNTQNNEFQYKQDDDKSKQNINIDITDTRNEDQMNSTVVDFADEHIGGLTLDSYNCAQEEILMLIYPEALVSMIFIPPMQANEAVLITNIKKYSNYSGYEQSFRWKQQNNFINQCYNMLAIDAKPFSGSQMQFKKPNLDREMLKCYSGFLLALKYQPDQDISTGRWGCGIFGGNQYLKTIIQLTCFAQAKYETNQSKAKLIINASSNEDLIKFGKNLQQYEPVLNLQNLKQLIKILQEFQFQNDYQFQKKIIDYLSSLMK